VASADHQLREAALHVVHARAAHPLASIENGMVARVPTGQTRVVVDRAANCTGRDARSPARSRIQLAATCAARQFAHGKPQRLEVGGEHGVHRLLAARIQRG